MKTLIVGDLHGDWGRLNTIITKKSPEIALQCGDFGWWPKMEINSPILYSIRQRKWKLKGVKPGNTEVYWCDGNHEEHPTLEQDGKTHEMYKGVNFCSRGSTIVLKDGRVVLFAGGASSVDKRSRTPGHDWFPEENILLEHFDRLMSHERVDIVISHTCPDSFNIFGAAAKLRDYNRKVLDMILEKYKPDLWYFGHWHKYQQGKHNNTYWTCLDYPGHGGRWWLWLPN